jgi:CRISPR-associated protein Csm5
MRYKVTALTPLLVGDGRALSPIDYMVWKDQVNVLDQTRIFKLLARGPRLEGYLSQLRKATKLDFASWGGFAQNFSQRRIPFEHSDSTAIWNAAPSEALFIPTFAASYRGAYLPASALKGALRTGLVFSRWSPATIDRIAASLEGDYLPRRTAEANENTAGASQVRVMAIADSEPIATSAFKVFLTRTASLNTQGGGKPQLAPGFCRNGRSRNIIQRRLG